MGNTLPIIVVAGLGRCGTTMVINMLKAGGVPVFADSQDGGLECSRTTLLPHYHHWLNDARGHAIKLLDPFRWTIPSDYDARFIVLNRDLKEQAKSQIKFICAAKGRPIPKPYRIPEKLITRVVCELNKDWLAMREALHGRPQLNLTFEGIIQDPAAAAAQIQRFVEFPGFNPEWAYSVVSRRSPACAHGLEMEMSLINQREGL